MKYEDFTYGSVSQIEGPVSNQSLGSLSSDICMRIHASDYEGM